MSPDTYVKEVLKTLGRDHALRVATRCVENTKPEGWSSLPAGVVFYKKNKQGVSSLDKKSLVATHNYWTQVYHILKKKNNG